MVKLSVLAQDPPFYKKTGGLFMYPSPIPKRWFLVGIAPILLGVETEKNIQRFLCHFTSNVSLMHVDYVSMISNFKPVNFCPSGSSDGWYLT